MTSNDEDYEQVQALHANFKLASKLGYVGAEGGVSKSQGAVFLAVCPSPMPCSAEDFHGADYKYLHMYMISPLSPGMATAPYQYARGSKLDKKSLQSVNKNGLPLSAWADTNNTSMRFWTWTKSGFNRGNRMENKTWEYSGGDVMTFSIEPACLEEKEDDNNHRKIPASLYLDGRAPATPMGAFDLLRVSILPKSSEALNKSKKTCFALKSVGPCTRTLVSYLPILEKTMCKTLEEATAKAEALIKEGSKEWAHQIDCMPGKDGDVTNATVNSVAFLETNVGMYTTFTYDPHVNLETELDTARMRMCVKATGFNAYYVDMPVRNVLRYTNANNLLDATGLLTIAACAGALRVFVMHNSYWASTETGSVLGEPTPFRGIPIIDASKLVLPILNENFLSNKKYTVTGGQDRKKARLAGVEMGFKTFYNASCPPTDTSTEEGMLVDSSIEARKEDERIVDIVADIALLPRTVKSKEQAFNSLKATDFRIAPHGSMNMEVAHVMTLYCKNPQTNEVNFTIMNLDFNAAPNVGGGNGAPVAGKKHAWNGAIPSAIDEDSSSENEDAVSSTQTEARKRNKAATEVAGGSPTPQEEEENEEGNGNEEEELKKEEEEKGGEERGRETSTEDA